MKKLKVGDIIKFKSDDKKGKGEIVEVNSGYEKHSYLVKLLGKLKGTGHDGNECSKNGPYETDDYWYVTMTNPTIELVHDRDKHKHEKIIIYTNGKDVFAVQDGKTAKATCNPHDEFDFETGARLAFERLFMGDDIKGCVHASYSGEVACIKALNVNDNFINLVADNLHDCATHGYTKKLVCIDENSAPDFTTGKIYEVVDGILFGDNGYWAGIGKDHQGHYGDDYKEIPMHNRYKSLEQINDDIKAEFIELIEE